jgi:hypothetical protein
MFNGDTDSVVCLGAGMNSIAALADSKTGKGSPYQHPIFTKVEADLAAGGMIFTPIADHELQRITDLTFREIYWNIQKGETVKDESMSIWAFSVDMYRGNDGWFYWLIPAWRRLDDPLIHGEVFTVKLYRWQIRADDPPRVQNNSHLEPGVIPD